jgi:hypothetical protein
MNVNLITDKGNNLAAIARLIERNGPSLTLVRHVNRDRVHTAKAIRRNVHAEAHEDQSCRMPVAAILAAKDKDTLLPFAQFILDPGEVRMSGQITHFRLAFIAAETRREPNAARRKKGTNLMGLMLVISGPDCKIGMRLAETLNAAVKMKAHFISLQMLGIAHPPHVIAK